MVGSSMFLEKGKETNNKIQGLPRFFFSRFWLFWVFFTVSEKLYLFQLTAQHSKWLPSTICIPSLCKREAGIVQFIHHLQWAAVIPPNLEASKNEWESSRVRTLGHSEHSYQFHFIVLSDRKSCIFKSANTEKTIGWKSRRKPSAVQTLCNV